MVTFANLINCCWCCGNFIFIVLLWNHKQKVKWHIRLIYWPLMFPSVTLHSTQSINKMALIWLWCRHCPLLQWKTAFFPWCFVSVLLKIHLIHRISLWHGSLSFSFYKNKLGQFRKGTVILRNNLTDYNWKSRIKYLLKINKKKRDFTRFPTWHWLQPTRLYESFILKTKFLSQSIAATFFWDCPHWTQKDFVYHYWYIFLNYPLPTFRQSSNWISSQCFTHLLSWLP